MSERHSVLIIDDEEMIRLTLRAYLEDSGYRVIEAVDGREGVELFLSRRPDVVLTDLRMPELDGFGVIAAIMAQSPDTPVFVITGTGDQRAAQESIALGARACLFKPFIDMEALERAMVEALARVDLTVGRRG